MEPPLVVPTERTGGTPGMGACPRTRARRAIRADNLTTYSPWPMGPPAPSALPLSLAGGWGRMGACVCIMAPPSVSPPPSRISPCPPPPVPVSGAPASLLPGALTWLPAAVRRWWGALSGTEQFGRLLRIASREWREPPASGADPSPFHHGSSRKPRGAYTASRNAAVYIPAPIAFSSTGWRGNVVTMTGDREWGRAQQSWVTVEGNGPEGILEYAAADSGPQSSGSRVASLTPEMRSSWRRCPCEGLGEGGDGGHPLRPSRGPGPPHESAAPQGCAGG